MAAPMVSGAVALLLQKTRHSPPIRSKRGLMKTADKCGQY